MRSHESVTLQLRTGAQVPVRFYMPFRKSGTDSGAAACGGWDTGELRKFIENVQAVPVPPRIFIFHIFSDTMRYKTWGTPDYFLLTESSSRFSAEIILQKS
ncbi:MAG: hypothetical protein DMG82_27685 [Acidobacteria bacterium]|nr:MAG: hypothetical protein DMG82_27685 [Acidobacteriota bacterium]